MNIRDSPVSGDLIRLYWSTIRNFWTKFSVISDEYRILKSRWIYLRSRGIKTLPNIDQVFERMENAISDIERIFGHYGLNRNVYERFCNFLDKTGANPSLVREIPRSLGDVVDLLLDISACLGFLKLGMYQRTSSLELASLLPGEPISTERSSGIELIYLAADKTAGAFVSSMNFKKLKWDGYITFLPSPDPFGAFGGRVTILKKLNLFHINLPEYEKDFLGSLFILAHELGHAFHNDLLASNESFTEISELIPPTPTIPKKCEDCEKSCSLKTLKRSVERFHSGRFFDHYINNVVADVIALYIAGPLYLSLLTMEIAIPKLADEFPQVDPARVLILSQFLQRELEKYGSQFSEEYHDSYEFSKAGFLESFKESSQECQQTLLSHFSGFGEELYNKFEKVRIKETLIKPFTDPDDKIGHVIKRFRAGRTVTNEDPRVILSAYLYLLLFESNILKKRSSLFPLALISLIS